MKVLLSVPMDRRRRSKVDLNDNGLGSVAAALKQAGHQVDILSWNVNLGLTEFQNLLRVRQPEVVGLKVFTVNFNEAVRTLNAVRTTVPEATIILGGPHPTTTKPADLVQEFKGIFDFAFVGEAERSVVELMNLLDRLKNKPSRRELEMIQGLVFPDGAVARTTGRGVVVDLDTVPRQDWHAQPPDSFLRPLCRLAERKISKSECVASATSTAGSQSSVLYQESRGCAGRCGHCTAYMINGSHPRIPSLDLVLGELETLITEHGVRTIEFTGNSFFSDVSYVRRVCEWLAKHEIRVRWGCTIASSVSGIDSELLTVMRRAGCVAVHYGIETGDLEMNRSLRKPASLSKYAELVRMTHDAGIAAVGYFMFGFPGETMRQMNQTIKYAFSLPFEAVEFCICLPLPATSSYREVLRRTGMPRIDWQTYNFERPNLLPCNVRARRVRMLLLKARLLAKAKRVLRGWKWRRCT